MVNFEEPRIEWRKSTASNSGGCVEVAIVDGSVRIRDSANPNGAVLELPPVAWSLFLTRTRSTNPAPGQA